MSIGLAICGVPDFVAGSLTRNVLGQKFEAQFEPPSSLNLASKIEVLNLVKTGGLEVAYCQLGVALRQKRLGGDG